MFQKIWKFTANIQSISGRLSWRVKTCYEISKTFISLFKEWGNENLNITQLSKYTQDKDSQIRRKATDLISEILKEQTEKLDEIYDKLVKIRDRMAKKLGYKILLSLVIKNG